MDHKLFYNISSTFIGILLGWLIAIIRQHRQKFLHETEKVCLKKQIEKAHIDLNHEKYARQQAELSLRDIERTQHEKYQQLAVAEERLNSFSNLREEYNQLQQELEMQRDINNRQKIELHEMIIRFEEAKLAAEEKQLLLRDSEQRLSIQFENLANRIFSDSRRKVDEQNRQSLDRLLMPLQEQLDGFRRQVQDSFSQEARERHTLKYEIRNLQQLNAQIAEEAVNLTRALKGDNKTQGNWGEVLLSNVLKASGLREGYEFETQISVEQEDGKRLRPDVIVHLPQDKDVVIDAKISMVAYERYFNSDDDSERQSALIEHVNSLRTHMKFLSRKEYQRLLGLRSLDYILMFVPIESAFTAAINQQPSLIIEAIEYNIMLVSPTTLLVALRTINNLWHYEHQSLNAQRIADRASRLYDKIRLFVDDINTIGQALDKAYSSYQLAKNKLYEGRGNLISQTEEFRSLGVKIKKPITCKSSMQSSLTKLSSERIEMSVNNQPIFNTLAHEEFCDANKKEVNKSEN